MSIEEELGEEPTLDPIELLEGEDNEITWRTKTEIEVELSTGKGNLTMAAAYILVDYFDGNTSYGLRELMKGKLELEKSGIIEEDDYQVKIPDRIEDILQDIRNDQLYGQNKYRRDGKNRDKISTVKSAINELYNDEKFYLKSYEIASLTPMSTKEVSKIMTHMENFHELNQERYRQGYTSGTTWNVKYLKEENII